MRYTKVSIWPVGLVGKLLWEGPIFQNGKVINFRSAWGRKRLFRIDMAGFAVNLQLFLNNPAVQINRRSHEGYLESTLLEQLIKPEDLEPLAYNCTKILVWHTRTEKPKLTMGNRLKLTEKTSLKMEV